MPPRHKESKSKEEDKPEEEAETHENPEIEQPKEHGNEEEKEEKDIEGEDSPKERLPTNSPIKHTMFIQDSDEEEDTRTEKEALEDKEIEIRKDEEEGDR